MDRHNSSDLSGLLRSAIAEKGISMRGLSKQSGLGVSTISRIVNGKQAPGILHLQAFSRCLDIPLQALFAAAGVSGLAGQRTEPDPAPFPDILSGLLDNFEIDLCTLTEQVRGELKKYEQYAATKEGDQIIRQIFPEKIKAVDGSGMVVDTLNRYYGQYSRLAPDCAERPLFGSVLLYFVLSADAIPDYLFPFGYLDDAIALHIVREELRRRGLAQETSD